VKEGERQQGPGPIPVLQVGVGCFGVSVLHFLVMKIQGEEQMVSKDNHDVEVGMRMSVMV
jgi:hypothetical protein